MSWRPLNWTPWCLQERFVCSWSLLFVSLSHTHTRNTVFETILQFHKIAVTNDSLASIEDRFVSLTLLQEERQATIVQLAEHISKLWDMLKEPQEKRDAFLVHYSNFGLSLTTIRACETCISALELRKQQCLAQLIGEQAEVLHQLWVEMGMSTEDCEATFPLAFASIATPDADGYCEGGLTPSDDILNAFVTQVEKTRAQLKLRQPMLNLIAESVIDEFIPSPFAHPCLLQTRKVARF